jgi:PAS domain S-box-containing protein
MSDESLPKHAWTKPGDRAFRLVYKLIEKEFGQLLESMPDAILITDTSGKIVLANSHAEKLFGYACGALVAHEVEVLIPDRFAKYHVDLRNAYIANPDVRPMGQDVLSGLRRNGTEFPTEISLSPMQTDAGLLICAAVRDVSQRMEVEKALRASEEQVRLLLDSTAEAIFGLDLQGNCTFCNQACVATLGYDRPEELLGKNMHNLIHHTRPDGSEYPIHECKVYQAFRHGQGTHVNDEVLWHADGSSFAAEYRAFPIRRDGELVGLVVTFLDITEQKRVAEALRTQQSELTHAARLSILGEMAAGLAHELNQPLTAMSAFAEGALVRLDRGKLQPTEVASVFSRIAEDAQRAGEIIRRLRNFVQNRGAQRQQIDINHLVRDVYKFVESDVKQEDISIQFELGNNLPAVEVDPIEIQQVLLNLIRNAYDALARSDCVQRRIVIFSHESKPDRVEIVVEDSGPGVSDSMAKQVFEPFYTSKADGLGIGLGICRNIIDAHGGKLWLGHSSMGGASIHFDLPTHQRGNKTDAS